MASRVAANLLFFVTFFCLVGKYCPFLEKKKKKKFAKMKKKSPVAPSFSHPAAGPETEVFFSLALDQNSILV